MARGPFHFKAFSVEQDGAAMKVGTDGIVLGCWTDVTDVKLAVDAGAGNGYVGIMLMQRMTTGGRVIGVELEPEAAKQAAEMRMQGEKDGVRALYLEDIDRVIKDTSRVSQ